MKPVWFRKWGWLYRPASIIGWLLTFLVMLLMARVFVAVDRNSHSVSDTLTGVLPWAWIFVAMLLWVVSKTSTQE
jgi:hypothetical protein